MLRIVGGRVYDPANDVHGEIRDICIANGRIVSSVEGGQVIDARGRIVFPGGVDVHTHIAGGKVNFARKMHPEDHRRSPPYARTKDFRSGVGTVLPSTFTTGYLYAGLGYTSVIEAATPPLMARHSHEELHDTPMVDKGFYVLLGNNETMINLLSVGEEARARDFVAWLVGLTKALSVKIVNPGGVVAWKFGGDAKGFAEPLPPAGVSPRQIVTFLARTVDELGLPHPVHIHCNQLGRPGNYLTTLETMRALEGCRAHMAHVQFHSYGGEDWGHMSSQAAAVAEYLNTHPNLTADSGNVLFGPAVTITGDGPWEHLLYQVTGHKWSNLDQENEEGCGIIPYVYREKNLVNAVQWAVGLEILLLVRNPWQIFLSTDHPNGGMFTRYPHLIRLLMDANARRDYLRRLPPRVLKRTVLAELDREYTLSEIAIVTRAGPARVLGLTHKGHLGVGADADVTIYNDESDIERMFANPRYVIKGGEIVVEDGELRRQVWGATFTAQPAFDQAIEAYLRRVFEESYTIAFDHYSITSDVISDLRVIPCRSPA
ncbi:MAG TPA: formylmethanofuran dehydrogenase subunit A [bacterium]|nr:formylmethanofuran dehydrogenase subunit A [bacterium]